MPQRSFNFLKKTFSSEVHRPMIWIFFLSFIIQVIHSEAETLFGAAQDRIPDLFMLGFSPEQPFRLYLLPWLLSGLVHISWVHFFQNIIFLLLVYIGASNKLKNHSWWILIVAFQILTNLVLVIFATMNDGIKSPNLYLGLSSICLGLSGFLSVSKIPLLRWIVILFFGYEMMNLHSAGWTENASYSHLISMILGFIVGLLTKNRVAW